MQTVIIDTALVVELIIPMGYWVEHVMPNESNE